MSEPLKIMLVEGIARITLNRPKFYNAFDVDMIHSPGGQADWNGHEPRR